MHNKARMSAGSEARQRRNYVNIEHCEITVNVQCATSMWTPNKALKECLATSHKHTHTHTPGDPGLAGCPLNSPSPFIPALRLLTGQA